MKYTQFLELEKLLEANDLHIKDLLQTPGVELIKEAEGDEEVTPEEDKEDKVKTKTAWRDVLHPKKALMRKSLNKAAKKLQNSINKDVAQKFLTPLINQKVKVYQKMAEVGKGKQPKEILTALKGDLNNIKKTTDKQVALIEKTAQSVLDNHSKRVESALQKKGLKDTALADLQSYWTLLCAQIMGNLLKKFAKLDDQAVEKTIQDKGILNAAKLINKELNKGLSAKLVKKDGEIKELTTKLKEMIKKESEKKGESEEPSKETKV